MPVKVIDIIVGSVVRTKGTAYKLKNVVGHDQHGNPKFSHGIALAHTKNKIKLGKNVNAIELGKKLVEPGSKVIALGLGLTGEHKFYIWNHIFSLQAWKMIKIYHI